MNTQLSAIARTLHRLSRKARIKLSVRVSLPPFVTVALDYSADINEPANHNTKRSTPHQTA